MRKNTGSNETQQTFGLTQIHIVEKQKGFHDSLQPVNSGSMVSEEAKPYGFTFWLTVAAAQAVGVACIVLAIVWGHQYGGFNMQDADLMFNYHPLFMILGLIFCYGDAIIVYRVLSFLPKKVLKIVHGSLHVGAILFASIALYAVLENHKLTEKADFWSIHSWVGILTFVAFCLQYVGSFITFLYPGLPGNWRAKVMPYHLFFGLGLFMMAAATVGMGITEKLLWTGGYTANKKPFAGVLGNALGLLTLVFAFLIVHIATHPAYKRKPLPQD